MKVLDGLRAKKKPRQIAEDIFGAERVAAEWSTGDWMRSQLRRWIDKAEALDQGGWRDLAPRYVYDE